VGPIQNYTSCRWRVECSQSGIITVLCGVVRNDYAMCEINYKSQDETPIVAQLVQKFVACLLPEMLLSFSKDPALGPYSELGLYSNIFASFFSKIRFNVTLQ
jgi:hypothetical protein